ncbi:MAG: ABC transporter ATP-binding protein [candidate division KSB1 bacterium]|nr:ABC transporter ATP-binding protein [candidate division KSB1 bacterium]MDZ7273224.1 ABC transporter ATP-binding protein [candidate division KSB1 bacterium]MDZ7285326.1 ABC transporter ATP-binding protein [candidate division KSB1 bacterium]MDZ7298358.1 ABC transporter ATP-binding protein [candidate division KSB1 bacterium]MDZ7308522.1 ABC transporter ATP-binding protein [candidate division KSB1 bacterium]
MISQQRGAGAAPVVIVENLTRTYTMGETQVHALRGVSFTIHRGESVAIMGPSGSGKSTILHLLGCLDRPTSGSYQLDGRYVERMSDRELSRLRNRKVGFVFQSFNLIQQISVIENVEVPLIYMGVEKARRLEMCRAVLESVGLGHRLKHRPNELSGGENQRVAIARALVTNPDIILADEPTGNLDSQTGDEIMEIFQRLHEQGATVILITHDIGKGKWAERILQMKDGLLQRELTGRAKDEIVDLFAGVA